MIRHPNHFISLAAWNGLWLKGHRVDTISVKTLIHRLSQLIEISFITGLIEDKVCGGERLFLVQAPYVKFMDSGNSRDLQPR